MSLLSNSGGGGNTMGTDIQTRVRQIVQDASVLSGEEQRLYIERVCEGQEALLERVQQAMEATDVLTSTVSPGEPYAPVAGMLRPGDDIGHYRIVDLLGKGGMGVVYRAVDTRLHRPVAIKVLPPSKVADAAFRERFQFEAQAASALNHPNIITIHAIEPLGDGDCIVMEFVDGQTLKKRLAAGVLDLKTVVSIASQVADAVAAAHTAGIVHRDLKPANIMITRSGLVKLLDFGIAKLASASSSGTHTDPAAEHWAVAGSAGYMSPEQAQGLDVDVRSDVYSFGVVLYEMLFRRHPSAVRGATGTTRKPRVIAEGLEVPDDARTSEVPAPLLALMARCMRVDRETRVQSMNELRQELAAFAAPAPAISPQRLIWGIAAAFLVLLGFAYFWIQTSRRDEPPPRRVLTGVTSDPGLTASPALSSDGKLIAYASDRSGAGNLDIWVQQVNGGEPRRLTSTSFDEWAPAFSPDGTQIAFQSTRQSGGVFVMPSAGGEAKLLVPECKRPRYAPNGQSIACFTGDVSPAWIKGSAKLMLAPADGASPARQLYPEFGVLMAPVWMPDGKHILFLGAPPPPEPRKRPEVDWWLGSIDGSPPHQTGVMAALKKRKLLPRVGMFSIPPDAVLPGGDTVIFSAQEGDTTLLWQIAISPDTGQPTGEPYPLTSGTEAAVEPAVGSESIVFSSQTVTVNVWSIPADSNRGAVTGLPQRLTDGAAHHGYPSMTADGRKLAFVAARQGKGSVRIKDLTTGNESLATNAAGPPEFQPKITPDGRQVAFWRYDGKTSSTEVIQLPGGLPRKLVDGCGPPTHFSPDGTKVLVESFLCTPNGLMLADVATGKRLNFLVPDDPMTSIVYAGRFSPDQRWLAFHRVSRKTSLRRIFVAPIRSFSTPIAERDWIPVSDEGRHLEAAWAPSGNLIYYLSDVDGFRCIWGQRVHPATKKPVGSPFALQHFHNASRSIQGVTGSMGGVSLNVFEDRIVLALGDRRGNIWSLNPEQR